jgi:hypothetical protein
MEDEVALTHLFAGVVEDEVTETLTCEICGGGKVTLKHMFSPDYLYFTLSIHIPPLLLTHLLLALCLTWQLGALTLTQHISDSDWESCNLVLF